MVNTASPHIAPVTLTIPGTCLNLPVCGTPQAGRTLPDGSHELIIGETPEGQPVTITVRGWNWPHLLAFEARDIARDFGEHAKGAAA